MTLLAPRPTLNGGDGQKTAALFIRSQYSYAFAYAFAYRLGHRDGMGFAAFHSLTAPTNALAFACTAAQFFPWISSSVARKVLPAPPRAAPALKYSATVSSAFASTRDRLLIR